MKIFLGADHNGLDLKEKVEQYLVSQGHDVSDEGGHELNPEDDFPVFASKVVHDMFASGDDQARGVLLCGSGQGMAIAANRFKGIRAVVLDDVEQAKLARNDDDSNVLALPAYTLSSNPQKAYDILDAWLATPYESIARRDRRIKQLDELS